MKMRVLFVGVTLFSLASCANLGSFQESYEALCRGTDGITEFDVCFKGRECYESASLLVAFPRAFETEGYEKYLVRYIASMLTLHEGTYSMLKKKHITTPALKNMLRDELNVLMASSKVQPDARTRILRELEQMPSVGEASSPVSSSPIQLPPVSSVVAGGAETPQQQPGTMKAEKKNQTSRSKEVVKPGSTSTTSTPKRSARKAKPSPEPAPEKVEWIAPW